jgi:hypothetical protein
MMDYGERFEEKNRICRHSLVEYCGDNLVWISFRRVASKSE